MIPSALRPRLSLPLVRKELVELANRKRTYAIRTIYAILLFASALLMLYDILNNRGANPIYALGRGRELFEMLVILQFMGIYIFLPALVCGAITGEKEANSLQLLLITDMRPWEILLSKLLSRLVPMFTFLLLGLPLLAIAYAFGGVTPQSLVAAVVFLVAAVLQVGALSLMASAWFTTTSSAFIGSYLIGLAVYFGPICVIGAASALLQLYPPPFSGELLFYHIPMFCYFDLGFRWGAPASYLDIALRAVPPLITTGIFLLVARLVFVRRALLPPKSALRALFTLFDRIFDRANRVTGGVVLIKDRGSLPGNRPVTWLEVHQRALSKARYLIRIFVLLEIPVVVVITLMLALDPRRSSGGEVLSALLMFIFPIAGLMMCVQAAGAFAAERRRQTLDVLLTTPMTGPQIVREKLAAMTRLMLVLALPLVTVVLFEAWWEHGQSRYGYSTVTMSGTLGYLTTSLLCIFIYLPLVACISMYVGMQVKNPTRAILAAVAVIIGWVAFLPFLIVLVCDAFIRGPDRRWAWMLLVSPASIVPINEFDELDRFFGNAWVAVIANFVFHGGLLAIFYAACLIRADRLLGRAAAGKWRRADLLRVANPPTAA